MGDHRVFLKWDDGSFIVLTDRGHDLTYLVDRFGPPTTVEFRAEGEGYVTSTEPEDDDPDDV
jgi:hypothetical protein